MKPNFALNITDTAISLLHRTSRGWLEVGAVQFDAPDLEEALGYLRASALGLSPHGITTKLILPPGQILYTEVTVSGPDKTAREAEIRTALEGRTPYAVEDLVFDWWGTGPVVKVAVVARETLEEAEAFAETHRFNPVSFVTTPPEGQFAGEPWFGTTKGAAALLPDGEKVTRDQDPVKVISRELPKDEAKVKDEPAAEAEAEKAKAAKIEAEAAEAAAAKAEKEAAEAEKAEAETAVAERVAVEKAAEEKAAAEKVDSAKAEAAKKAEAGVKAEADAQKAKAEAKDLAEADAEALRKTEASRAEMELRAQNLAQAEAKRLVEEAEKTKAAMLEREKVRASMIEAERRRETYVASLLTSVRAAAGESTAAKTKSEENSADEAAKNGRGAEAKTPDVKTTDTENQDSKSDTGFVGVTTPSIADADAPAITPTFASRRRDDGAPARAPAPALGSAIGSATQKPLQSGTAAPITDTPADRPKGPSAPTLSSGVASGFARAPRAAGPAVAPTISPAVAPLGGKAVTAPTLGAPKAAQNSAPESATSPAAATGKLLNGTAAFATGAKAELGRTTTIAGKPDDKAAKGGAAMVTAARIPGTASALSRFKSKVRVKPAEPAPVLSSSAAAKAADASMAKFGAKASARRGKPRFLGLIMTLVLLAVLAAIAAWSSIYLSRDDTVPETVQQAELATPATTPDTAAPDVVPDAEAIADAEAELPPTQDLAALARIVEPVAELGAEPVAPAVAEAPSAQAPVLSATDVAANTPTTATPSAVAQDDAITLAAIDSAPPAFDVTALPKPMTRPDAAPMAVSPPPPFGTQYEFEPDGTIKATSNGVVMPDGFWLIAARPSVVPPARPAAIAGPAIVAPAEIPSVAPDANAAATPPPDGADPAAASTAGISRMEGAVDGTATSFGFEPDATVENRRPAGRPASITPAVDPAVDPATAQDDAALIKDPALAQFAQARPRVRPRAVVIAAEEARKAAEAASLAATAASLEKTRQDSALAVALSPRPTARPRDFSRAVEAAIAAATREAPRRVAAAAAPAPRDVPDAEQADEPELKVSAAPRIPTRANVAKQATFKNAINLSKTNLIGVYGTDRQRYALIRSSSGRYTKVRVGDRLDGGTVAAITRNEVRYKKGSKMLALAMPNG